VAAANRLIPKVLVDLPQSETAGWMLLGVTWLSPDSPSVPGGESLRRVAKRLCGIRVARASWGLSILLPQIPTPASRRVAFVTTTQTGWAIFR